MRDPRDVKRILDLEYELAEYKRQLAEQMLIDDRREGFEKAEEQRCWAHKIANTR